MGQCLQVDIKIASSHLTPAISLFCGLGSPWFPLLVDEGYLFVDNGGVISFLCVDRR